MGQRLTEDDFRLWGRSSKTGWVPEAMQYPSECPYFETRIPATADDLSPDDIDLCDRIERAVIQLAQEERDARSATALRMEYGAIQGERPDDECSPDENERKAHRWAMAWGGSIADYYSSVKFAESYVDANVDTFRHLRAAG